MFTRFSRARIRGSGLYTGSISSEKERFDFSCGSEVRFRKGRAEMYPRQFSRRAPLGFRPESHGEGKNPFGSDAGRLALSTAESAGFDMFGGSVGTLRWENFVRSAPSQYTVAGERPGEPLIARGAVAAAANPLKWTFPLSDNCPTKQNRRFGAQE